MLRTLAVANYRSIRSIVISLGRLNLITGANGSGKSNLYLALRLLADTAAKAAVLVHLINAPDQLQQYQKILELIEEL